MVYRINADKQKTQQLAGRLANKIVAPLTLSFKGDIGAGKTTFIRFLIQALDKEFPVKSPTFSLVESYSFAEFTLHHFDLYRLRHPDELETLGFREYFGLNSICCIEWLDKVNYLAKDLEFSFIIKPLHREIIIEDFTAKGNQLLTLLANSQ